MLASGATAGDKPVPPSNSAVSVYVEQIPTSKGSVAAGRGTGARATLTPSVARDLEKHAGKDGAKLADIATSPSYGAPTDKRGPSVKSNEAPQPRPDRSPSGRGGSHGLSAVPEAAVGAPNPGYGITVSSLDPRVIGLIALVMLLSVIFAGIRVRHRRKSQVY